MDKSGDEISKYKAEYKRIGSIRCAYFDDELIHFNRKGLNHLLRKGKMPRPEQEQLERMRLVRFSGKILAETNPRIEYRIIHQGMPTEAHFWGFKARINEIDLKLIIRQMRAGAKHFFSIFPIKH
jgi:hypothetical protein